MADADFLALPDDAFDARTKAPTRRGGIPLTDQMLRHAPSGDVFGLSQDVGMGWTPAQLNNPQVLILSTMGGLRQDDGTPLALGYHTGHWELGLLVKRAAERLRDTGCLPFAAYCSDPCDGRSQGTPAMMDSLAYRNSAAEVMGRLIRSLPRSRAVLGIATCDKGLPAMTMALAAAHDHACVLVPGGVTLPPETGEDAGTVQSIGARYSHGELSLEDAAALGCAACASPGGGCQFLGTAASAQVIGEALGMSLPHSALAPSGERVWLEIAAQSADAVRGLLASKTRTADLLTDGSVRNAIAVHAAFGASTNLLLHLPAVAHAAGLERPTAADWEQINRQVPRLVDALPNGPRQFKTVQVFMAGGVPEVMLHLRNLGALDLDAPTVTGQTLGDNLDAWEQSERRERFRAHLTERDGVDPANVIMPAEAAAQAGLSRTLVFPTGNLAPEGSVVKATAIAADLFDDGIYHHRGQARVFLNEDDAIAAMKSSDEDRLLPHQIVFLLCRGPLGAGMPETAQITIALKYTAALKNIPLITDGRFSGFSSGPCIGHVGPEALADGPIGKIRDGDWIEIRIDGRELEGSIHLIGEADTPEAERSAEYGQTIIDKRHSRNDLAPDDNLPEAVRLWAALQQTGGGVWGGCVYDVDRITQRLGGG